LQLELLSAHANEAERFGEAEKYFYELSKVPSYGLRVEAMLQVCNVSLGSVVLIS
jgi:hypothetical protein